MKRLHYYLLLLISVLTICGCIENIAVKTSRNYRTDNIKEPTVTVLLSSINECEQYPKKNCYESYISSTWNKKYSSGSEMDLATCIYDGIRQVLPAAVLLPPQEGRIRFLRSENAAFPPVSYDRIQPLLTESKNIISNNDFIVIATMSTIESNKQTQFSGGSLFIWFYTTWWDKHTTCSAEIIDVTNNRVSGTVTSSVAGIARWGIPFLVILPLPPYIWFAGTEDKACTVLGRSVGSFLTGIDVNNENLQ